MREEASLKEWGSLYEAATKLKEKQPWEKFWDMDLIGIQEGEKEDTVFFSILGRGDSCYGIVAYEGYSGLNDFMMLATADTLNLSTEYTMFSQDNLTCYWGNREELTAKQRETIKQLGYKYRGKNQWLYFLSYAAGYFPYNLDRPQVLRMTEYFAKLLEALEYYESSQMTVNFSAANMFLYKKDQETGQWKGSEAPLPFTSYRYEKLTVTNQELEKELNSASKNEIILEADMQYLGASVQDKKYDRPGNPCICIVGEAGSGLIMSAELTEPEEDPGIKLAQVLASMILTHGAPREVHVTNVITAAVLEDICAMSNTELKVVSSLESIDESIISRFRGGF
jgi:hypothetical protein